MAGHRGRHEGPQAPLSRPLAVPSSHARSARSEGSRPTLALWPPLPIVGVELIYNSCVGVPRFARYASTGAEARSGPAGVLERPRPLKGDEGASPTNGALLRLWRRTESTLSVTEQPPAIALSDGPARGRSRAAPVCWIKSSRTSSLEMQEALSPRNDFVTLRRILLIKYVPVDIDQLEPCAE